MPNDEEKKRWRVRQWGETVQGRGTALEDVLNALDADGYDIYDVRYENNQVVAKLKEPETDDNFGLPMSVGDLLKQAGVEGAVATLQQTEQVTPPPPQPPEDDATREMRAYKIQGMLTPQFMTHLRVVLYAADNGDPFYKERLEQTIRETFSRAPFDEVSKTLKDVEFFKAQHEKHNCDDTHCASMKVFEKTVVKLRERLAANPLS
jgi:hypothetical protein